MGMRPKGSAQQLEQRRHEAVALSDQGLSSAEVAVGLGCTARSVRRWLEAYAERGPPALDAKPHAGRPSKLTARQKRALAKRLVKGARACGFATDLWTGPRIAALIRRLWGIQYHDAAMPRFLAALGFTCQRPEKQAAERDEEAIAGWVAQDWPRIKRGLDDAART